MRRGSASIPARRPVLERYQRWRRFDTMAMGMATDGLNRLFSNRSDVLRFARDLGLGMVDRLPGLKRLFIREAAGLVGDVPKLLKGEVLVVCKSPSSAKDGRSSNASASGCCVLNSVTSPPCAALAFAAPDRVMARVNYDSGTAPT